MKDTNTTTNNTNTNNATVNPEYDFLKPMVCALKRAHATNNARVISKDFAMGSGVPESVWRAWVRLIEDDLYPVALAWGQSFNDKSKTEEELQALYAAIFPIWRRLCKVGNESKAHKHLFIRESDVVRIAGYSVKPGWSINGTVETAVGGKDFRKSIETMLGIRMAQNAVMSTSDYETMTKYEKAKTGLEKALNSLNGYDRNGEHKNGLKDTLAEKKKTLETAIATAKSLGIKEADLETNLLVKGYIVAVEEVEDKIKATEATISKLKTTISKLEADYKKITAKIAEIK